MRKQWPRNVTGQPYNCPVTVTRIGAKRQGGDGRLRPADDGCLTPEQAAQLPCDCPWAAVNFLVRHEAEARTAAEEFARLFGTALGVLKDVPMVPKRARKRYGAPAEGGTRHIVQGSSECTTQMTF